MQEFATSALHCAPLLHAALADALLSAALKQMATRITFAPRDRARTR